MIYMTFISTNLVRCPDRQHLSCLSSQNRELYDLPWSCKEGLVSLPRRSYPEDAILFAAAKSRFRHCHFVGYSSLP
jgi:hypothetical protein